MAAAARAKQRPYDAFRLWDLLCDQQEQQEAHTDRVFSVAVSTDGATVVSGSEDNSIRCGALPCQLASCSVREQSLPAYCCHLQLLGLAVPASTPQQHPRIMWG